MANQLLRAATALASAPVSIFKSGCAVISFITEVTAGGIRDTYMAASIEAGNYIAAKAELEIARSNSFDALMRAARMPEDLNLARAAASESLSKALVAVLDFTSSSDKDYKGLRAELVASYSETLAAEARASALSAASRAKILGI
jgi:cytidine deaminase